MTVECCLTRQRFPCRVWMRLRCLCFESWSIRLLPYRPNHDSEGIAYCRNSCGGITGIASFAPPSHKAAGDCSRGERSVHALTASGHDTAASPPAADGGTYRYWRGRLQRGLSARDHNFLFHRVSSPEILRHHRTRRPDWNVPNN